MRLPKRFRFDADEVFITKMGSAVVLIPKHDSWTVLFEALEGFTEDFMEDRGQPSKEQRRDLEFG